MKIGFLIHGLNSGGAERQLVLLAKEFKTQGHEVAVCIYTPDHFYKPVLDKAGISLVQLSPSGRLQKYILIYRWLREWNPQILQAFLPRPNALAILTTLLPHQWKVVVSERDAIPKLDLIHKLFRRFHRRADWVVTNSYANMDQLLQDVPNLKCKSSVIWNMVDLEHFTLLNPKQKTSHDGTIRFLCAAGLRAQKNGPRLIEALNQLRNQGLSNFHVRWVGKYRPHVPEQIQMFQLMQDLIRKYQLESHFEFGGEIKDMVKEYTRADALVLVSSNEGVPNVMCEAMACQLPVVLSDVGDNARFIQESGAGFLCAPHDTQSITDAMGRMISLSGEERKAMGYGARSFAEKQLNSKLFFESYSRVYEKILEL